MYRLILAPESWSRVADNSTVLCTYVTTQGYLGVILVTILTKCIAPCAVSVDTVNHDICKLHKNLVTLDVCASSYLHENELADGTNLMLLFFLPMDLVY